MLNFKCCRAAIDTVIITIINILDILDIISLTYFYHTIFFILKVLNTIRIARFFGGFKPITFVFLTIYFAHNFNNNGDNVQPIATKIGKYRQLNFLWVHFCKNTYFTLSYIFFKYDF